MLPDEITAIAPVVPKRWGFRSHGGLTIAQTSCGAYELASCPRGPVRIVFSTPVTGAQVAKSVKLVPAMPFTLRDTAAVSTSWVLEAALKPRTGYAIVESKSAGRPNELDRLLWHAGHRPSGISKFGTGTAALRPELPDNKWSRTLRGPFAHN